MGTAVTWTHADPNGFPGNIQIAQFTLTADATGADYAVTDEEVTGKVVSIEVDPGAALKATATLKGYRNDTALATGTRDHWMDYAVPNPAVEVVYYPLVESSATNANGALTTKFSQPRRAYGKLRLDLAGADENDAVVVTVAIEK